MLLLSPTSYSLAYLYKPTGDRCHRYRSSVSYNHFAPSNDFTPTQRYQRDAISQCVASLSTTHQVLGAALRILLTACLISLLALYLLALLLTDHACLLTLHGCIEYSYSIFLLITRLLPFNLLAYSPKCFKHYDLPTHYLLITYLLPI